MGFRYWYKDPDGDMTEIVGQVRLGGSELVSNAEEGGVGSGNLVFNDPTGSFMIRGHRLFMCTEDEASGDDFGGVVWLGYTGGRGVGRGENPARGAGRDITPELVDINTLLYDRILHGEGNKRPEEEELARVRWLLGQSEVGRVLDDDTFIASTDGTNLDARDVNGDTPYDVLDDAAQQSGRNYFLLWQAGEDFVPDVYLWYKHGSDTFWPASVAISNFADEWQDPLRVETPTVLAPSRDAELQRDPSRVYSHIRGEYDGGFVIASKQATANRYRIRWTEGQWERVKSETKALHRAHRTLDDIDSELDEITLAIEVTRPMVNCAMAGQSIAVHLEHLPGYGGDDYVNMRIKSRTVRELSIDLVELALVLTADSPSEGDTGEGSAGSGFAVLDYAHGPFTGDVVRFAGSGDVPPRGWISQPTVGLLTPLSDSFNRPYYGIQVDGDGTVDVSFFCSITGVITHDIEYTVVWAITLNGADVATSSKSYPGGLHAVADSNSVEVLGLAVSNGDIIGASLHCLPARFAFFRTPAGVGVGGEQLKVSNGSLS